MDFAAEFTKLAGIEGGYSDRASDSGGKTKYGITEAVARAHGYKGKMEDLPYDVARAIAKKSYWDVLSLDAVSGFSPAIAHELFDTGYNMGVEVSARFLQRSLNVLNMGAKFYADIKVDGQVGPKTVEALKEYLRHRPHDGEKVMLEALNALQGARYIDIAEHRPKDEDYVFGWFRNRVGDLA